MNPFEGGLHLFLESSTSGVGVTGYHIFHGTIYQLSLEAV